MTMNSSAGSRFRQALQVEKPLQIVGTINAYTALMAEDAGFKAIYLSGAGVANAAFGLPDLGITTLNDVVTEIGRIVNATDLPVLVDADTGWGHALNISRVVREFTRAGAAGLHIEDQESAKRCGHRPNKAVVPKGEMCDRILAAVNAKTDPDFVIMARTDALASENIDHVLDRCRAYVDAGADMIFAEAVTEPEQYAEFTSNLSVPVLANMTEFGKSPLLSTKQLNELGIAMVLYPLSAFRAMNAAAERVYRTIRQEGSQQNVLGMMQDRQRLYEILRYHQFEEQLDRIIEKSKVQA
ncbi:MAG TPA: methylisocitrate lyase [Pirellulaceae bacterium]|nr:methylisocitrate lyase [Pirellulaceae bacterium]HMO93493.1 methylisocitrate lyase [Pirellulaceae bacterium]HMP70398.1 methylisocitrate lyase [Pirellulaceae bacterium]